jgi:hypothetical protein
MKAHAVTILRTYSNPEVGFFAIAQGRIGVRQGGRYMKHEERQRRMRLFSRVILAALTGRRWA